jgi:dTDP-4-amino-4,6-dideoxygalactose transaminase
LPVTEATEDTRLAVHGGNPVRRTPWPTYEKGAVFVHPEDEDAALRAIRSHLYFRYDHRSHQDTECGRFEEELRRYFGSKHALAVSSGTTALVLAIMASEIPPDSLIACPSFTFVATPSSIALAGCKPFLVDVDENLHMDLADLRRRWTPGIKAIMVVHMRGFAADMEALTRFAAEMGVPVFEDAVPALGAELKGRKLGTLGLAGAFSTQSDKSLNCGEGGFLLTDDSHALCCEGIDARNLGSDQDDNVRVCWNWRFMFDTKDIATIKALLPNATRYLAEAVDIPLSSNLSAEDCDDLVKAVRKVAGAARRTPQT